MHQLARNEPALTVATLTALATAMIGLLVAFGVDISDAQRDAILGFIAAAFPIIILLGGTIRQFVSPAYKVDDAYRAGLDDAQPTPQRMSTKPSTGVRRATNVGRA